MTILPTEVAGSPRIIRETEARCGREGVASARIGGSNIAATQAVAVLSDAGLAGGEVDAIAVGATLNTPLHRRSRLASEVMSLHVGRHEAARANRREGERRGNERRGAQARCLIAVACAVLAAVLSGCGNPRQTQGEPVTQNPVVYFEIPVHDLDRAVAFYEQVFRVELERADIDGNAMALFPHDENDRGISGALAKGESYVPGRQGARIYFATVSIEDTLARAVAAGGRVVYPKTSIGALGWVAELEDSEGNVIALHTR